MLHSNTSFKLYGQKHCGGVPHAPPPQPSFHTKHYSLVWLCFVNTGFISKYQCKLLFSLVSIVTGQAGLGPTSWLTWFWTAWPKVKLMPMSTAFCGFVLMMNLIKISCENSFLILRVFSCRCKGDRHRRNPGARPRPKARDGTHQGESGPEVALYDRTVWDTEPSL